MSMYERIRNYIDTSGLKLNYVADKAGIGRKRFYRLLNGETPMSVEEYERICRVGLSLSPSYFFENNFLESKNKNAKQPA